MNVPPYVPEPIQVPGNVAREPHTVMLGFVRRVSVMHAGSLAIAYGIAFAPFPALPLQPASVLAAALLACLSLVRTATRPSRLDLRLSLVVFPFLLVTLGWVLRGAMDEGLPVWSPLAGIGTALVYTFVCGRDYSFVGNLVLSALVSSIGLAAASMALGVPSLLSTEALAINVAYLFYWVYDLASLLTRRRLGEEAGAVVDLYRDVLNGITYPVQLLRHWRESRIWNLKERL